MGTYHSTPIDNYYSIRENGLFASSGNSPYLIDSNNVTGKYENKVWFAKNLIQACTRVAVISKDYFGRKYDKILILNLFIDVDNFQTTNIHNDIFLVEGNIPPSEIKIIDGYCIDINKLSREHPNWFKEWDNNRDTAPYHLKNSNQNYMTKNGIDKMVKMGGGGTFVRRINT